MELFIGKSCEDFKSSNDPRDCMDCTGYNIYRSVKVPDLTDDLHVITSVKGCGFIHLVNRPSQEQLDTFYRDEFFQIHKPKYAQEEQKDIAWHRMMFADRLEDFTELLGRKPESVLDIGCGTGLFLRWLSGEGIKRCVGIEPNMQMCTLALANSSECVSGSIIQADSFHNPPIAREFDVVVLQFVLEHVLDPETMIRQAVAHLKPDGILYVCCPNDFTDIQEQAASAIGKPFYWVHVPDHCNYFNFDSLEKLLTKCSLHPVLRDATFPMEGFLVTGGLDYTSDGKLGRYLHKIRMAYELALDRSGCGIRRNLMRSMAMEGRGRDCIVYSRKRGCQ